MIALVADFRLPASAEDKKTIIRVRGSDTMVTLAQAWAEAYQQIDPTVWIDVSGSASGDGLGALIRGAADLADSSRPISPWEVERAQRLTGKTFKEYIVAYDALSIYVHKENPLAEITVAQLAGIYGAGGQIARWSDLGLTQAALANQPIIRVSRQPASGTYEFLRARVLGNKDYKGGAHEAIGSKQVIDLVAGTPAAIGYAGMGCRSPKVKALKVAARAGDPARWPTAENVLNNAYPISRPLRVYTLGEPPGAVKAYLDWLLSEEAQQIVEENGYVPVRIQP